MTKVTNTAMVVQSVHVKGGKKGEPKFESIQPGETKDLDLADRNSEHNKQAEAMKALAFGADAGPVTPAAKK